MQGIFFYNVGINVVDQGFAIYLICEITGCPQSMEFDKNVFQFLQFFLLEDFVFQRMVSFERKVNEIEAIIPLGDGDFVTAVFGEEQNVTLFDLYGFASEAVKGFAGKDIGKAIAVTAAAAGILNGNHTFFNIMDLSDVQIFVYNAHKITALMITQSKTICNIYVRKVIFVCLLH